MVSQSISVVMRGMAACFARRNSAEFKVEMATRGGKKEEEEKGRRVRTCLCVCVWRVAAAWCCCLLRPGHAIAMPEKEVVNLRKRLGRRRHKTMFTCLKFVDLL